ncbi:universal stress protein Sll1388-like [Symsagittifera roscoffensis]|uniref:universal stress protein Sll1388-like n=1 Tax=Symsagittifera roscoffensis TaxID=84072 RepID=UPI00307C6F47
MASKSTDVENVAAKVGEVSLSESKGSKSQRKIVIAIDASGHSERALRWYLNNFHRDGDHLFLFHAVELPTIPVIGSGELFYKETLNEIIKEKHEEIKKLTLKFELIIKKDNLSATFNARDGDPPGHNIVHYAREKDADCIVIGCRGLGSIRRTILGSTSDYVIHHAHLPVIVVPPVHH